MMIHVTNHHFQAYIDVNCRQLYSIRLPFYELLKRQSMGNELAEPTHFPLVLYFYYIILLNIYLLKL